MADINVIMIVDTAELSRGSKPEAACVLYDTNGDKGGSSNFTIHAHRGENITFYITAKNGITPVSYSAFRFESGSENILNPLPSCAQDWTSVVEGRSGQKESFYIDFVSNGVPYTLDPQIEVDGPDA